MSEVLLSATGLTKRYGGVLAVDDVAVEVSAGEVLGIVGPNGAGKTSLIDILTGVQTSDDGALSLSGVALTGGSASRAQKGLARTFQHPQLCMALTIRDNLLTGVAAHRMPRFWSMVRQLFVGSALPFRVHDQERVEAVAEIVGLRDLDREARSLTLGEQRLVEVGRALAQRPTVLLLDEPFAGADEVSTAGITAAVRQIRAAGHGVILVDHNIDLVAGIVDRMMLMTEGRVAFVGDPAECMASATLQEAYFGVGIHDE